MTPNVQTDTESFRDFLNERIDAGLKSLSPEEAVREFREYQRLRDEFLAKTKKSIEEGEHGQYSELDKDALVRRLKNRLAEQDSRDG